MHISVAQGPAKVYHQNWRSKKSLSYLGLVNACSFAITGVSRIFSTTFKGPDLGAYAYFGLKLPLFLLYHIHLLYSDVRLRLYTYYISPIEIGLL